METDRLTYERWGGKCDRDTFNVPPCPPLPPAPQGWIFLSASSDTGYIPIRGYHTAVDSSTVHLPSGGDDNREIPPPPPLFTDPAPGQFLYMGYGPWFISLLGIRTDRETARVPRSFFGSNLLRETRTPRKIIIQVLQGARPPIPLKRRVPLLFLWERRPSFRKVRQRGNYRLCSRKGAAQLAVIPACVGNAELRSLPSSLLSLPLFFMV